MLDLPCIEVAGTPAAMGEAIGEALRAPIHALSDRRTEAIRIYVAERGLPEPDLAGLGGACLDVLRGWHLAGWEEHVATARSAGLDPAVFYALVQMTDVRDLASLPAQADAEGCTAVLVPSEATAAGSPLAGQTWDLNAADVDCVVAVKRTPDDGPSTWSVTVAGAPTLMGMNEHGLAVGTTNIKVAGARTGVGYMSLLHRAVQCNDRREAAATIMQAPRIAAHTYWCVDDMGVLELECDAMQCTQREGHSTALSRTNHCLHAARTDAEPAAENSIKRLATATAALDRSDNSIDTIRALFADRSEGICSINRRHDDGEPTATNACVIADPSARVLHACRGEADRGQWLTLGW